MIRLTDLKQLTLVDKAGVSVTFHIKSTSALDLTMLEKPLDLLQRGVVGQAFNRPLDGFRLVIEARLGENPAFAKKGE